jgi:hypothetical protein
VVGAPLDVESDAASLEVGAERSNLLIKLLVDFVHAEFRMPQLRKRAKSTQNRQDALPQQMIPMKVQHTQARHLLELGRQRRGLRLLDLHAYTSCGYKYRWAQAHRSVLRRGARVATGAHLAEREAQVLQQRKRGKSAPELAGCDEADVMDGEGAQGSEGGQRGSDGRAAKLRAGRQGFTAPVQVPACLQCQRGQPRRTTQNVRKRCRASRSVAIQRQMQRLRSSGTVAMRARRYASTSVRACSMHTLCTHGTFIFAHIGYRDRSPALSRQRVATGSAHLERAAGLLQRREELCPGRGRDDRLALVYVKRRQRRRGPEERARSRDREALLVRAKLDLHARCDVGLLRMRRHAAHE